ncbi:hypothetical protein [Methylomonas fluvii]|uniref:hypothetical protein n=1 Tax=Methylomonas fluvii TaxID=1854564 RepID=UPI0019F26370|nr:hypothetical protein [Methylomonas fluvii]CAD6873921.1 hypothetical protein [Methylomonas fluvii]
MRTRRLDAIATWGAKLVLTLVEPAELKALKVPQLGHEIRQVILDSGGTHALADKMIAHKADMAGR